MACKKEHSETDVIVSDLPIDQGGAGRHKCAAYAYEIGYQHGLERSENINLGDTLDSLVESQKGQRRHKSPHAAYALGYLNGVR
ncbi:hypothetical protein ACFSSB_09610 [Lacinutrix gracilariae]|uniref:Uncharacterized protein n=1 Tax=Lacinutrix gracilariae TaxID=1747198 RepID=A0ABW5K0P9_9FLAO